MSMPSIRGTHACQSVSARTMIDFSRDCRRLGMAKERRKFAIPNPGLFRQLCWVMSINKQHWEICRGAGGDD